MKLPYRKKVNKKPVFVIVEGKTDVVLLQPVFNHAFGVEYDCKFLEAFSFSNIISRTKTLIDLTGNNIKIIVLFDSDETSIQAADLKLNLLKSLLDYESYKYRLFIDCFHPDIERALIPEHIQVQERMGKVKFFAYIEKHIEEWIPNLLQKPTIQAAINFVKGTVQ